jgi:DNA polymerase IV
VRGELERLLRDYTPDVTVSRQGTCLLDLSRTPAGRSRRPGTVIAKLQEELPEKTGLERPAAGLSASSVVARILARMAPSGGIMICQNGGEAELLARVETRMLPGLTPGCRERLRKYGLNVVGQVQRLDKDAIVARFGGEGERLYCMAHGIDVRNGAAGSGPLFVETVLERDTGDSALLLQYLHRTVDRFCHAARLAHLAVRSVLLSICYTDRKCARKTIVFSRETDDYLTIMRRVKAAFDGLYSRRVGLRSLAMSGRRLGEGSGQTELFAGEWDDKQGRLGGSIARVREQSGFDAVFTGGDYGAYVKEAHYEENQ